MQLLDNQKQSKFQTFSCGSAKVTFDDNGYIVKAKGLSSIMWGNQNQDEKIIGKHIIEFAKMLKKSAAYHGIYISFLENVVLKLYEKDVNDSICELEGKGKQFEITK